MADSRRKLHAGASGYSFKEWKGIFYPDKCKPEEMLPFYSERISTVEINNTFYRMPQPAVLEGWVKCTPPHFRFAVKASRRITHMSRIKDSAQEPVGFLYKALESLGEKRGPVLFQLPPNLAKDLPRLEAFLAMLPKNHRAALEFRNDSWFEDDVYAALQAAGAALVLSEREDSTAPALVETAPWGYLRLRLEHYGEPDLAQWAEWIRGTGWKETYAYFMHEPTAPAYAQALVAAWDKLR